MKKNIEESLLGLKSYALLSGLWPHEVVLAKI